VEVSSLEAADTDLHLRRMRVDDLDALMALNDAAFSHAWTRSQFERELGHDWSTVLLAEDGDRLVGFLVYWVVHDELHILNVAADPIYRRRGIATALLTAGLKQAQERALALATLEVRRSNAAAQALYLKLGFEVAGVRRNYYADLNEDAIVMNRKLSAAP
jgi:ribosomal-protein-alanine N-acetyltransferase